MRRQLTAADRSRQLSRRTRALGARTLNAGSPLRRGTQPSVMTERFTACPAHSSLQAAPRRVSPMPGVVAALGRTGWLKSSDVLFHRLCEVVPP